MADLYFVGDTDDDWADASNWATGSGDPGGAGVPTSSDNVIFDLNSPNCTLTGLSECANFDVRNDYVNTFDLNGNTLNSQGAIFRFDAGTFTNAAGLVQLANSTSTTVMRPDAINSMGAIHVDVGEQRVDVDSELICVDLDIDVGVFDMNGNSVTATGTLTVSGTLVLNGTETIVTGVRTISTGSTVEYDGAGVALLDYFTVTYENLTLGASKVHEVTAGETIVINGAIASKGTIGTQAILRTESDAAFLWALDLNGTSLLGDGIDVKYSEASAGKEIAADGSSDSGNNTNWNFVFGARFRSDRFSTSVGSPVKFTDDSTNDPDSWAWTFGDGETSMEQNPTHVYDSAGTYTVVLTATNDDGADTETKEAYIVVLQSSGGGVSRRKFRSGASGVSLSRRKISSVLDDI